MSRPKRTGHSRASIKYLVATIIRANSAPKQASEAEKKLIRLADPACVKLLLHVLIQEYPPWYAADSAIRILHALKASDQASKYLIGKLKDRRWRIRAAAAAKAESFPNSLAGPALVAASKDRNVDVSINAIHSLWVCSIGSPKLKNSIIGVCANAIKHSSHGVRRVAFECLSHLSDARARKLIAFAAKDPHPDIRQQSKWWIQEGRRAPKTRRS